MQELAAEAGPVAKRAQLTTVLIAARRPARDGSDTMARCALFVLLAFGAAEGLRLPRRAAVNGAVAVAALSSSGAPALANDAGALKIASGYVEVPKPEVPSATGNK